MAATGFRHGRRITVQVLALFVGLFVLVAPTSSAATSSGSPSPSSSASPTSSATAALTQVTAVAPTWKTVACGGLDNLLTIPTVSGVEYLVNGKHVAVGTYGPYEFGDSDTLVVTAQAEAGYVLSGISSWRFSAYAPECVAPRVTTNCGSFTVKNLASYAIGFSWRSAGAATDEGYYPNLAPGASRTISTKFSSLDLIYAPTDDGMLFSIEPLAVPQNCAPSRPTSTSSAAPKPAATGSATTPAKSTGPAIITDGGTGNDHANGALLIGGLGCAFGCAVGGFGVRRRLRR